MPHRGIVIAQALASSGQLDAQQLKGVILLLNTMWTDPWVGGGGSGNGEAARVAGFGGAEFDGVAFACGAAIWATSVGGFAAAGCGLVTARIVGFACGTEAVL